MPAAVPEPRLSAEELALFEKGIAEFGAGRFFECHDTLEELWSGVRGPSRDFFQGLIQVSVACYHWSNGNAAGARSLLDRAQQRLAKYPDRYFGFDLAAQRALLARWLDAIRAGEPLSDAPRWHVEVP